MSDKKPASSEELRKLRDDFAASAKANLAELDRLLLDAQLFEEQQRFNVILKQFMPGEDKAALKGHEIVFLVNRSKDMGNGIASPIGAAVDTVYKIHTATKEIEGAVLSLRLWGSEKGDTSNVFLRAPKAVEGTYSSTEANDKHFLNAAKEILVSNTPDKPADRHYIIVSDGKIADNTEHLALVLEAAAKFNPKTSFDFIVCGAEAGAVGKLVEEWGKSAEGRKPSLAVVSAAADIPGVAMQILKARLGGNEPVLTVKPQPAPKADGPTAA